jgi:diguanylate cyclase (GGDEF)-like protein
MSARAGPAEQASSRDDGFRDWQHHLRTEQVRYVAILTAGLYFLYAGIESVLTPDSALGTLQVLRAAGIGLLLSGIALISLLPTWRAVNQVLLVIAPVTAVAGNLYLVAHGQSFELYAPEIYLALVWTFSVSGLTLRHAIPSTAASTVLVSAYVAAAHPEQSEPLLHLLWVLSALAFGLLSAFLLERRDRRLFAQRQRLERLAAFDDLTGLWNQRQIRERLAREIARCERTGAELSVIMLDIDHFKQVNDRFGHVVGDAVLAELGALLSEHVRNVDLVGRIGGEEFLVVLPETEQPPAVQVAEKLRLAMAEHAFSTGETQTASFGVAAYHAGDSLDDLLERADQALYGAKRAGRNRVVTAGD